LRPRPRIGQRWPPGRLAQPERDRTTREETGETITLFKGVVFDAHQVEPLPSGEPTPLQPPSQPLSGHSHGHLIAPTIAFAESLGYTGSFAPIAGVPASPGRSHRRHHHPGRAGRLGLHVSGETVPYVAGWGEDGSRDAVTEFAQLIDDLARRVETALSASGDTQQTAATG
jgi:hypothetical protein